MDLSFPAMVSGISDFPGPVQRTGSSDLQLPGNFIFPAGLEHGRRRIAGYTVMYSSSAPASSGKEIRLELLFLTHSLTAILGIVATVNGRTAMDGTGDVDWKAFLGLSGLIVAGGFLGLLLYRYRLSKRKNL